MVARNRREAWRDAREAEENAVREASRGVERRRDEVNDMMIGVIVVASLRVVSISKSLLISEGEEAREISESGEMNDLQSYRCSEGYSIFENGIVRLTSKDLP